MVYIFIVQDSGSTLKGGNHGVPEAYIFFLFFKSA
jgi:hypothetical protein